MKKILEKIYPYIAIVLFPIFLVNRLFLEHYLFYGEERGFLNYDFVNYRFNSIWESSHNFGAITTNHFNIFTTGLFWKITTFFNLSWFQSEAFFFYTLILFTLLFSFLTFKKISKNPHAALLLSIIYITTYNYYAIITTTPKLLQALIIPASLFFWLTFKETHKIRYFLLNIVASLLCLGVGINLPQMIGAYSFIFLYILFFDFKRGKRSNAFFFYLPYILNLFAVFLLQVLVLKNTGQVFSFNVFDQSFSATDSVVHEILRFFGGWWDYEGSGGLMYNHMSDYYHSTVGVAVTYLPVILFTLLAFIQKQNIELRNRLIIFAICMLFLAKGGAMPFGELFNQAYTHIEYLKIFREPWAKFIFNFIFAIYVGIAFFFTGISEKFKKLSYGLLAFLLFFQLIPLTLGHVIDHRNLSWKVSDVNIPEYWQSVSDWSKFTTQNKRVLMLPAKLDTAGTLVQNWSPFYFIGYPDEFFIYGDLINSQYNNKEDEYITSNFLKHLNPSLLSLASVEYVIDKKDLVQQKNEKLLGVDSIKEGIDLESKQQYGGLDIYHVKEEYISPRLRTVPLVVQGPKNCSQFFSEHADADFRTTAFIPKNAPKEPLNIEQPQITRISSTEYAINFSKSSSGVSALFFAEAFNTSWKLYDSKELFAKPLPLDNNHYLANCLGNLWLIPQSVTSQNPILYMRFEPQLLYEKAKIMYLVILSVIIALLSIILFKKKSPHPQSRPNEKFSIKLPISLLTPYRSFLLYIPPVVIAYTFLTPRSHHEISTLLVAITWILIIYLYQLPTRVSAIMVYFFLSATIINRLINFKVLAESMGIWTIVFLFIAAIHSYILHFGSNTTNTRKSEYGLFGEAIINSYQYIYSFFHVKTWNWQTAGILTAKIALLIALIIPPLHIFNNIEREQYKQSLIPTITSVMPEIAQRGDNVTIKGTMFVQNKLDKPFIRSTFGDVAVSSVSESSISFRIPATWKPGIVEILIARPTRFDGQYVLFESGRRIIEIK